MPDAARNREFDETDAVELTPTGRGAVAVVLVAGPAAVRIVEQCFAPARRCRLADVPLNRIVFGRFGGARGEEVVVCRRLRDQVEIHCHGGTAAVSALVKRLVDAGCRRVSWPEWLQRTCSDPIQAAAQVALAEAPTARTAAILLDQYQGALTSAVGEASVAIREADSPRAAELIDSVLAHRDVGLHLTSPWRVVLAGPANVGKSSLINSLAGFQRSIVSQRPGTTRDVVTTMTAIDGWPVLLADTAGIRNPQDALESAGIELAAKTLAEADLVVVVGDATASSVGKEADTTSAIVSSLAGRRRSIRVLNKVDLVDSRQAGPSIYTSAVTGEGIADLVAAIGNTLVPCAPVRGAAVPFTDEQVASLEAALAAVQAQDAAAGLAALRALLSDPARR